MSKTEELKRRIIDIASRYARKITGELLPDGEKPFEVGKDYGSGIDNLDPKNGPRFRMTMSCKMLADDEE